MGKKSINKRPLTYEEEHNKAYDRFKKSSRLLIWVGALNVISLLISIINYFTIQKNLYFYFCFGFNDLIFQSLALIPNFFNNMTILYFIVIVLIALLSSAGAILLSVFASQGKKKYIFGSIIFYLIDTLMIIPCAFLGESYISILLMSVLHIVILSILIVSIYEYYKIIEIAKRYGVLKEREGDENVA